MVPSDSSSCRSVCEWQLSLQEEAGEGKEVEPQGDDEAGEDGEMDAASIEEQKAFDAFNAPRPPDAELQLPEDLDLDGGQDADDDKAEGAESEAMDSDGQEPVCEGLRDDEMGVIPNTLAPVNIHGLDRFLGCASACLVGHFTSKLRQ